MSLQNVTFCGFLLGLGMWMMLPIFQIWELILVKTDAMYVCEIMRCSLA